MKQSLVLALAVGQTFAAPMPSDGPGGGDNEKALAHIEQMFSSWQNSNGNSGQLSTMITSLSAKFPVINYGCYCFLNTDPASPGGSSAVFAELPGTLDGHAGAAPLDALDSLCYELRRYQQCVEMDVSAGVYDPVCVLNDGYYYQTIETTGNGNHGCTEEDWKNEGEYVASQSFKTLFACRHALCMGDRHFVNEVSDLYENGGFTRTQDYFGMNQKGTYAANCPASTSGGGSGTPVSGTTQCCGFEVDRKPMSTANAQCCVHSSTNQEYLAGLGDICA